MSFGRAGDQRIAQIQRQPGVPGQKRIDVWTRSAAESLRGHVGI